MKTLEEMKIYIAARKTDIEAPSMSYINRYVCSEAEGQVAELKQLCEFLGLDYDNL